MEHERETSELLREWRIESELPQNFNAGVWRRIELAQTGSRSNSLLGWAAELFSRPAMAAGYVAVALGVGVIGGQLEGSWHQQQAELEAKSRYIQTVDPYAVRVSR